MIKKKTSDICRNNIKNTLVTLRMSKTELAKKMNVSLVSVVRYLAGSREISLCTLDKISNALDIKPQDLINPKLKVKIEIKKIIVDR